MANQPISVEYGQRTILDLRGLQENNHLNLEPGFQRKSVWNKADRSKLIESILQGFPVPSIFLYCREDNGIPVYDVLDGKQRLETIFMFSRVSPFSRDSFEVKHQFEGDHECDWWDWKWMEKERRTAAFLNYKIQIAEVKGELSDIIDLFVRINSTGKALSSSETRHARFYKSPLLKEAEKLAKRHRDYLKEQRVLSQSHIDRMKDVELVSELLASIIAGGPIHKKQAVDKAVGNSSIPVRTLNKAVDEFTAALRAIYRMFPDLRSTRFHNISEFYTLFMVVWDMNQQKLVLNNRKLNDIAMKLLIRFSNGVDEVREQQRLAKGSNQNQRMYADYLLLVQQSTDSLAPRKRRAEIIHNLLSGIFENKDENRIFSSEQRRLLWNSDERKKCKICGEPLDWNNFQVDHIKAHSRGGKTEITNAQLSCVWCNASKGAGSLRR